MASNSNGQGQRASGSGPPQFTAAHASALTAFLEAGEWQHHKQIVFEPTEKFSTFLCCSGIYFAIMSLGIGVATKPVQALRGSTLAPHFGLALDHESLTIHEARNDCCCHVQTLARTVPLNKVQDIDLTANWVQSMFDLQQLEVQTAIRDGEWEAGQPRNARRDKAAVQAAFLADPERAREAIRLAIRLHHRRRTATTAPVQAAPMAQAAAANGDSGGSAAGGGGSAAGGGGLAERLARMQALVARGTLTAEEAAGVRAAPEDPTARIVEAADLAATGAIAAEELAEVKARWLAALA